MTFLVQKYVLLTNYFHTHKIVCACQGSASYHLITVLGVCVRLTLTYTEHEALVFDFAGTSWPGSIKIVMAKDTPLCK